MSNDSTAEILKLGSEWKSAGQIEVKDPVTGKAVPLMVNGLGQAKSLETELATYRQRPARRSGFKTFFRVDSFCEYVNRFKGESSVVIANQGRGYIEEKDVFELPTMKAILNHAPEGGDYTAAEHEDYGAVYSFPLSSQWREWSKFNKRKMSQPEFAEFIERNAADLYMLPAASESKGDETAKGLRSFASRLGLKFGTVQDIISVARGLKVNQKAKVVSATNSTTGDIDIAYSVENETQTKGGAKLQVPSAFVIAIPVFDGEQPYLIGVRLMFRLYDGSLSFIYELYRPEDSFKDAFEGVADAVASTVALPTYYGQA